MLQEEEKELRIAMHEACEESGVSQYIEEENDTKDSFADENCNAEEEQVYLDQNIENTSYTDIRDWVEGVVNGFKKGMQFDGIVDRKRNVRRAVAMFIKSTKGQYIYSSYNSLKSHYNGR